MGTGIRVTRTEGVAVFLTWQLRPSLATFLILGNLRLTFTLPCFLLDIV